MNPMNPLAKPLDDLKSRISKIATLLLLALPGASAFGLESSVVVNVAQLGEGYVVDATTEVDIPLGTVWDVLTDYDHMALILSNLKSSKVIRRDGNTLVVRQEGVARLALQSFAFESEREIRLEPMTRISAKNLSGTVKHMESELRISQSSQGVQIKYHAEMQPGSTLVRMFGGPFVRHEIEEQFNAMTKEMVRRHTRTG